jgi:PIN domain nuclease of toxin-antitoxin system
MQGLGLDTHAVIWYLAGSRELSAKALTAIEKSLNGGKPVYVSAISLVEII